MVYKVAILGLGKDAVATHIYCDECDYNDNYDDKYSEYLGHIVVYTGILFMCI
tara:strand:+ start:1264 stop:1422 length:159 start_codon:yes stop_codon:yes gene_type:complete